MKGVAKLKDEARKHEQREEWEKAIDAYLQVLKSAEGGDEEVDLPLYNRVGDLFVRLGKPADAVLYYEQAADQYAEAGLYNNAIALCNKALRYVPNRLELIRKLGQFSGAQGFLTDARRWYLEYAERQLKAGALDEAFKALDDFATVHEDAEIRELLGRQLKAFNRVDQAVSALKRAFALRTQAGQLDEADRLKTEILGLRPDAFETGEDFSEPPPSAKPVDRKPRRDDIEIWQPPPVEAAPDLGLETAASAAFGVSPEAATPSEVSEAETSATEEAASTFEVGDIGLETTDLGGAPETVEEASLIDVADLGIDGVDAELPMIEAGADELPSFEIESASLSSELGLELVPTNDDFDAEPLPLLDLDEPIGAGFETELPLLDVGDLSMPGLEKPSAEFGETASNVYDALPLETFDAPPTDSLKLTPTETFEWTGEILELPGADTVPEPEWEKTPADLAEAAFETEPEFEEPLMPDQPAVEEPLDDLIFEEPATEEATIAETDLADIAIDQAELDEVAVDQAPGEQQEIEAAALEEALIEPPLTELRAIEPPAFEEPTIEADPAAAVAETFVEEDFVEESAEQAVVEEVVAQEVVPEAVVVEEPLVEEPLVEEEPPVEQILEPLPAAIDPGQELKWGEELAARGEPAAAILHYDQLQSRLAAEGHHREAWQACTALLRLDPANPRILQQRVEHAAALSDPALLRDSYLDWARSLVASGDAARARSIFQRVLEIDPGNQEARQAVRSAAPPPAGYVDLMAYIGEKDEAEASTRFVVAEKPPTGDEERDFADMLSQFKQKVAEHVSVGEASAHYDLGLAFKEMGLIDEAIAEFQTALKGGEERLKVYEELGQCFLLKQQYNVAVTVLNRALQMPVTDDSSLVGVYYALGRSHEELGQREEARRAYERVVGLDINFRDATQRLAAL